jgi:hypothetical protein
MSSSNSTPEQAIRVMQIIAAALVMGVVLFGLIALFVFGALDDPSGGFIISLIAVVFASGAFVMHLIVPNLMTPPSSADVAGGDDLALYKQYQARTIVGLAMLEGAAFFNIIATIVEHNWWSLAVAGVLVFWMLAMFPTRTRVKHWVETQSFSRG